MGQEVEMRGLVSCVPVPQNKLHNIFGWNLDHLPINLEDLIWKKPRANLCINEALPINVPPSWIRGAYGVRISIQDRVQDGADDSVVDMYLALFRLYCLVEFPCSDDDEPIFVQINAQICVNQVFPPKGLGTETRTVKLTGTDSAKTYNSRKKASLRG
ncbi:6504_t:CDS:2 [Acaulospora colombiana]|uniref:6504_t:CDS:1 n=1 Tax=Acaulospora colombiana TaxID=27376 RepID=A0ACA9N2X3_9GLOM|nr:6504_t:CDS:2 [Acaulospora colombiana]